MRKTILLLAFMLAGAFAAKADTLVVGTLSFTFADGTVEPTATRFIPTEGSFVYDTTVNQFLSFYTVWDGITFDLLLTGDATEENFLVMTGQVPDVLYWDANCIPGLEAPDFPCDGSLSFRLQAGTIINGTAVGPVPLSPTVGLAQAGGLFTVRTPEPTILATLLLVLGGWVIYWGKLNLIVRGFRCRSCRENSPTA